MNDFITINQIKAEAQAIATAHLRINDFYFGSFLDAYTNKRLKYTALVADVLPTVGSGTSPGKVNYKDFTVVFTVCDQVLRDDSNYDFVKSDTEHILSEVLDTLKSPRWRKWSSIQGIAQAQQFRERGSDSVTGWTASVVLRVINFRDLCALPMPGYDFNKEFAPGCLPAIITDGLLEVEVDSGARYICQNGVGVKNVTTSINGTLYDTTEAPGAIDIPVVNSLNQAVGTTTPGVKHEIADGEVQVNNITVLITLPESTVGIDVIDEDENPVGSFIGGGQWQIADATFTDTDGSTSQVPPETNYSATLIPNLSCAQLNHPSNGLQLSQRQLIQAVNTLKTGQTTSYRAGDDGDLEQGRGVDFYTLSCNNPFGNTNRYTDTVGGQTYADGLILDWFTGLMWYNPSTTGTWNQAIDAAQASTIGGYSDWFLPNINQLFLLQDNSLTSVFNYSPFNITASLWSGTTQSTATTSAQRTQSNGLTTASAKGGVQSYIYCRYFTLADLGF